MNATEEFYLNASDRGFLATADSSGRPTVVPVCFVYENGSIYIPIDDKPKKGGGLARVRNLVSNPRAALIVDNYSQDWNRLSYLLIHGRGRLVEEGGEKDRAKDLLRKKYMQYPSLKLDIHTIIAVAVDESKFWTFQPR